MARLSRLAAIAAVALLAFPAGAAAREERPVVESVSLEIPPGEDAVEARSMVAVKAGEPLSPRAVRRTVQLLYQTGRYANVVVRALPAPPGPGGQARVRVVVVAEQKRVVGSVRFKVTGVAVLSDLGLRAAAGLEEGEELTPGRLEAAEEGVRAVFQRRGYRQARVEATASGTPTAQVELAVVAGAPTRVAEVTAGPSTGLPEAELLAPLSTREGSGLDLQVLDQDLATVRKLLRQGGYYRARVGVPEISYEGETARVRIPVEAGPRILFRFAGNEAFDAAQLRDKLGFDVEIPLDEAQLEASADRLRLFLRHRGYTRAWVSFEEIPAGPDLVVLFHVDEGRPYRVEAVEFAGPTFHSQAWMREQLDRSLLEMGKPEPSGKRAVMDQLALAGGTPPASPAFHPEPFDPRDIYDDPVWSQAVGQLIEKLRDEGFLEAASDSSRASIDTKAGLIRVEIRIREGVRTLVESIAFEGNQRVPLPELARRAKLAPGDPLSLGKVEETRLALLDEYVKRGFVFAQVESSEEFTSDRALATVRYRLEEGPQVRIAGVVVAGNKRTRESLIRSAVLLEPGDVYLPARATASQAALLALGVFSSANLALSDPDVAEAEKYLMVDVEELAWQSVVVGAGFSIADGPRVALDYTLPNLFGRALEFATRLKVNYPLVILRPDLAGFTPAERIEGLLNFGLRYPRLFTLPFLAARADLIGEHRIRSSYDIWRGALAIGLDVIRFGVFSASLTYEVEADNVESRSAYFSTFDIARAEEAQNLFPVGFTTLNALRPTVSLDLRDNSAHPRKGLLATATAEYAHNLGGSQYHINYVKLFGTLSGYVPVGSAVVLALSARGGRVYALDPQSVTIAPKRFYLGGATTMRGYGEAEMIPQDSRDSAIAQTRRCATVVSGLGCSPQLADRLARGAMVPSEGAQAYVLFKAEVRIGLGSSLELGLFADVGNLWFDPTLVDLSQLRVSYGLGLRLLTPVGPAAFDVGFNVNPDPRINEPILAPHFTIGFF